MTESELQTREAAVAFLRERGFHAFLRTWAMGETIGVASRPFKHGEIEGWERMVYIAASPSGWPLHNLQRPAEPPGTTSSLRQACDLAIRALQEA
jgi:hypothetical protein